MKNLLIALLLILSVSFIGCDDSDTPTTLPEGFDGSSVNTDGMVRSTHSYTVTVKHVDGTTVIKVFVCGCDDPSSHESTTQPSD